MECYSTQARTPKYEKEYRFLSFGRNLSNKYGEQLMNAAVKKGLNAAKTTSKNQSIKQLKQQENS